MRPALSFPASQVTKKSDSEQSSDRKHHQNPAFIDPQTITNARAVKEMPMEKAPKHLEGVMDNNSSRNFRQRSMNVFTTRTDPWRTPVECLSTKIGRDSDA